MNEYLMTSKKVGLRQLTKSDINSEYCMWLNDKQVTEYMEARYSIWNINNMVKYLDETSPYEYIFAICCLKTEKHIGNIKLGPIDWINRKAEISILIGNKNFWGKGFGTDAVALVNVFAFETLSLNKLIAGCYIDNKGSAGIFIKNGFIQEGLLKKEFSFRGNYTDGILFGKLNQ